MIWIRNFREYFPSKSNIKTDFCLFRLLQVFMEYLEYEIESKDPRQNDYSMHEFPEEVKFKSCFEVWRIIYNLSKISWQTE